MNKYVELIAPLTKAPPHVTSEQTLIRPKNTKTLVLGVYYMGNVQAALDSMQQNVKYWNSIYVAWGPWWHQGGHLPPRGSALPLAPSQEKKWSKSADFQQIGICAPQKGQKCILPSRCPPPHKNSGAATAWSPPFSWQNTHLDTFWQKFWFGEKLSKVGCELFKKVVSGWEQNKRGSVGES